MKYLYRIYQLFVALPIILVASILVSLVTIAGCLIGNGHFWGYWPAHLWARIVVTVLWLPGMWRDASISKRASRMSL